MLEEVKKLVEDYKRVLRRLREARAEARSITDKIFQHFQEWMKEREKSKPSMPDAWIWVFIDEFYEDMGIKDPHIRTGLSIRLQRRLEEAEP